MLHAEKQALTGRRKNCDCWECENGNRIGACLTPSFRIGKTRLERTCLREGVDNRGPGEGDQERDHPPTIDSVPPEKRSRTGERLLHLEKKLKESAGQGNIKVQV